MMAFTDGWWLPVFLLVFLFDMFLDDVKLWLGNKIWPADSRVQYFGALFRVP